MKHDIGRSLPPSWTSGPLPLLLGHDGVVSDGDWVETKDQDPAGDVRLIQLADIGEGTFRDRSNRFLTSSRANELGCTYLQPGDLLVARMPDPLGRACIFPRMGRRCVTAVDVCIVRPGSDSVNPTWLMHAINSPDIRVAISDIVINRVNSPGHLGKALVVADRHVSAVFESNMMRLSLTSNLDRRFLRDYLNSPTGKRRLTVNAKWAVNQASINQQDVARTVVPMPPLREQHRIAEEVERLLSEAKNCLVIAERGVQRARRLRQSILRWAFEGKLVDQDPADEPASALLERIRADRQKTQATGDGSPGRGRKRKTA